MAEGLKPIHLANCAKCGRKAGENEKFCPLDGEALFRDPDDGWGRGSDVKRLCKVPEARLESGELIEISINGEPRRGEMLMTFAEYEDIMSKIETRLAADRASRHGDPLAPRIGGVPTVNRELGAISGQGRRA